MWRVTHCGLYVRVGCAVGRGWYGCLAGSVVCAGCMHARHAALLFIALWWRACLGMHHVVFLMFVFVAVWCVMGVIGYHWSCALMPGVL